MKNITVIGLGYRDINGLTLEAYKLLFENNAGKKIICRTATHAVVAELAARNIEFETLDRFYEGAESFDDMYEAMVSYIASVAEDNEIYLCVSGSPVNGDLLVNTLFEHYPERIKLISGEGVNEFLSSVAGVTSGDSVNTIPAHLFRKYLVNTRAINIITEADNKFLVSEIKLKLLEMYPEDHEIIYFSGYPTAKSEKICLFDADRQEVYDFSVNFIILPLDNFEKKVYDIGALCEIMRILRGRDVESSVGSLKFNPEGCSWDREQTHESIRQNMIEEAYEVVEAINNDDLDNLIEELGDMLLQVVFHSQIASETGEFEFRDVIQGVAAKLVRRHPHVFGDTMAANSAEALTNWEQVKKEEKSNQTVLNSITTLPKDLPPFTKAQKVIGKTASKGFKPAYSPKANAVMEALKANADTDNISEILFAVCDVLKQMEINPDVELKKYTDNYVREFSEQAK